MQHFPRYMQYKDSGLPWVGEIPAHWQTRRNRFLFREVDRRSAQGKETHLSMSQVYGLVPSEKVSRKSLQSENYAGGKLVAQDDLVLNRLKAHLGVFARAKESGVVSPDYTVLRPIGDISVKYCESLFKTPIYVGEFRRRTKGIVEGFWRLYTDDFYNVTALLPPREEQDQIVAYLRAQDAHIARYILAKRELIKLLTEQKLRIIDHAVTRGLDPNVRLKPSGIEWLGEVPEHWEVSKVKLLADYINGFPFKPAEWGAKGRPIIRIQNLTKEHAAFNYYDGAIPERNHVKDGDILLSWSASLGVFVWNRGDAWLNQHIFKVVPDPKRITRGYFVWLARWFLNHMEAEAHGSTMQHITKPKFGSFPVPLPSLNEQVEIEAHINRETQDIDLAIARTEDEIKLIREYRDRLIADVVTGQIDVRGWRPGPDDVVSDEDLAALGDDETELGEDEPGDGGE